MQALTINIRWFTVFTLMLAFLLTGCQTRPAPGLSPAQIAVLEGNGFQFSAEGWGLDLSGKILFGFAEDEISQESQEYITLLTTTLLDAGLRTARVDGHTDNTGDSTYNRNLSLRRAISVATVMANAGMPSDGIQTRGLGDSKPVSSNQSREGRGENRRVSIIITSP